MTAEPMSIVVMMLMGAAVLAWPSAYPVSRLAGRASADVAAGATADAAAAGGLAGAATRVDAGFSRTGVPVAEVAGVIDLLALTLRAGAGLVEAMEAVAARVGGPLICRAVLSRGRAKRRPDGFSGAASVAGPG